MKLLVGLALAVLIFVVIWELPLFYPVGSLVRYALEELRVLVTGIYLGAGLVLLYCLLKRTLGLK